MDKGIYGLAYLEYNYEKGHHDIIDAYIPLICHCLYAMKVKEAEVLPVREKLKELYGLNNITDGAIISIFNRMAKDKYGLLKSHNNSFLVIEKEVAIEAEKKPKENLVAGFDVMVERIEEYSKNYQVSFTLEEVEKGLYHFMDQYDVDLTLGNIRELCQQLTKYKKEEKKLKYIISKYLIDAAETNPEAIRLMVKLAKGHALTSLVCLQNITKMTGSLKDVEIYLDAPIVFNLLDLNDSSNYHLAKELMQLLKDNGAKFRMFEHNYNEVVGTLTDARDRLATHNYDLRKSSRLLKMAHRDGMSSIQIDMKIGEFAELMTRWDIETIGRPSLNEGYNDIDVITLRNIIEDVYTRKGTRSLFWNELNMLETDLDSITYIYRLRGNLACTSLKNSKAILLTTNRVISTASHDRRINVINHAIPACSTDIFLSTILWTNYPGTNGDLNQKLLMSECYNSIELDDQLMLQFYDQIAKKRSEGTISEAQYLQATTSRVALEILADKTLNDINAYTDRTATEVLEIIEQSHKADLESLEEKHREEMSNAKSETDQIHKTDIETIEGLRSDLKLHDDNIKKLANSLANISTGFIFIVLLFVFIYFKLYPNPLNTSLWFVCPYYTVWLLVTCWAVLSWFGRIPPKKQIHRFVKQWFYKVLSNKLNKKTN